MLDIYEIRKNVPVRARSGLSATIRQMVCGDSIVIPAGQHLGVHSCAKSVGAKVRTASNKDGTVTVWRIDHPTQAGKGAELPPKAAEPEQPAPTTASPSIFDDGLDIFGQPIKTAPTPPTPTKPTPTPKIKRSGYYQQNKWGARIWTDDLDAVTVTEDTIFS